MQVMVAEPQSRGKGLAHEALILLMLYGSIKLVPPPLALLPKHVFDPIPKLSGPPARLPCDSRR